MNSPHSIIIRKIEKNHQKICNILILNEKTIWNMRLVKIPLNTESMKSYSGAAGLQLNMSVKCLVQNFINLY